MRLMSFVFMNRSYFKKIVFFIFLLSAVSDQTLAQQTIIQYLSGTDKDHTVAWNFMCTTGRNSGKWSKIPVPSCWEMQGFGSYNYYEDKNNPDEKGLYKFNFNVASKYKEKKIFIVFGASMTDTKVKINGQSAGPIHQGGFYEFKYDITDMIHFGKTNLLEVTVSKESTNASVNRAERKADFWLFGGIFRPVYLEIVPQNFIERVAIDAKANGDFNMQVFNNANAKQTIEAQVYDLKGKPVGNSFHLANGDSVLHHHFTNIKLWNLEQPNLYNAVVSIKQGTAIIHSIKQRFGFRTAELRKGDGFYVNGKKVIFKGVCRHSEWPETGRTLSRSVHLLDIRLMKAMNMNAVRMSHYPPDKEFLDLCDSLGLFVLDELTGWQAAYDTTVGSKLVKELVIRDVNHPSIVIWDNGNEGGWNWALDGDYALYDPQNRLVIHPWEKFNGTNTKHYPDYKYIQNEVANGTEVFFPTEFIHGLFDGGQGAGLEDFWDEMMKYPRAAGGFLWSFIDEGVVRADRHDSIDVAGNFAPDGILGPYRQKEGSYYTIKELWSPVYIDSRKASKNFNGTIEVQNRYIYTNLNQCSFKWELLSFTGANEKNTFPKIIRKGTAKLYSVAPGQKTILHIPLPGKSNADAFYISVLDAKGDTICTWSWAMHMPSEIVKKMSSIPKSQSFITKDDGRSLSISCDGITYYFDKETGFLQKIFNGKKNISLSDGPSLASSKQTLSQFKYLQEGDIFVVEPLYEGDSLQVKWIFQSGQLPKLEYSYITKDVVDFMGITFNYPEEKINGMKWLGRGPYRVWKNRLKGQQLGVWQKAYNNTVTGQDWNYPEFKGWHSELYWVKLQNKESDFIIYTDQPNIYLEMLHPEKPKAAKNDNVSPPFPEGDIGFMHGISPIGTKFHKASVMGPQSQMNVRQGNIPLKGTLYFDFR
ncbi:MAG: glycoside hydrolase family 2 TIM barrel-domain containing protein [Bacteroidota bacterium]|nr:glycoside hydrolase family 2 TIM barrel-domain containing protein [Bacteroidota bacterium]